MAAKSKVSVLVVDDSEVVRVGLKSVLDPSQTVTIVGEANSVASAVEAAAKLNPQVVLLDIRLPDGSGFDACRSILKKQPACRILILSSAADDSYVDEAIRAGVHGYILKEINGKALIQAILDVAAGKSVLDPQVTARIMQIVKTGASVQRNSINQLSTQERRLVALIAQGFTNKEVAAEMGLAEKTVKNYLATVFEKLHVTRRAQVAALYAQETRNNSSAL